MISNIYFASRKFILQFNLSQRFYILALALLILIPIFSEFGDANLPLVGVIASLGLAAEVWPKFVKAWESLLGRILIVFFYALVTNLAVAIAAQNINRITGVEPSSLFYSLGFTTLIMAPFWLIGLTVVGMTFYMIFVQILLILKLFARLFAKVLGIPKAPYTGTLKFPVWTSIARLVLLPIMLFTMGTAIEKYSGGFTQNMGASISDSELSFGRTEWQASSSSSNTNSASNVRNPSPSEVMDVIKKDFANTVAEQQKQSEERDPATEVSDSSEKPEEANKSKRKDSFANFDHLIASFIHTMEMFKYSQCVKAKDERVMSIGEFDILVSKPDDTSPSGYRFSVRTCKMKNY